MGEIPLVHVHFLFPSLTVTQRSSYLGSFTGLWIPSVGTCMVLSPKRFDGCSYQTTQRLGDRKSIRWIFYISSIGGCEVLLVALYVLWRCAVLASVMFYKGTKEGRKNFWFYCSFWPLGLFATIVNREVPLSKQFRLCFVMHDMFKQPRKHTF